MSAEAGTNGPAGQQPPQGPPGQRNPQQAAASKRLQHTQAQVDEVVGIMRTNVEKVLERDQKLAELDDRADALQQGASQFEQQAGKLKRKFWWKNCKMWAILIGIGIVIIIIIVGWNCFTFHLNLLRLVLKIRSSSKSHQSSRSSSSGYDQPSISGSGYETSADAKHKAHYKNKKMKEFPSSNVNSSAESSAKSNSQNTKNINSDMKQLLLSDKAHDGNRTSYGVTQLRMKGFLSKMKKLQKIYEDDVLLSSTHESEPLSSFPCDNPKGSPTTKTRQDRLVVAATLQDGIVLHCSASVFDLLGFSKDLWIGQNLIDFVYPKDRAVFTSHVTMNLPYMNCGVDSTMNCQQLGSFYCRFRVHSDIKDNCFGIGERKASYQAFHISTKLADFGEDSYSQETASANGSNTTYVLVIATPIKSTYHLTEEIPPMRTFTTRHLASCHFSLMDASAIPYLGYLPQDILGNSVFDYYHPEDLPDLQDVYQQILKEEGKLFRSKPYRFRVGNGGYALMETEWSCFINPWSRKLEFIIGQHRVLKGPKEPDVFADSRDDTCSIPEEVLKESRNIQMEIKQVLNETVMRASSDGNKENNKRIKELAKYVGNLIEEMVQTIEMDTSDKAYKEESFSEQGSVVMGHISPHHQGTPSEPSAETLPSYHHCNYNDNIQRYFDSRPKTHSTDESAESKEGTTPPATYEDGKYSPRVDTGSGDETVPELNHFQLNSESEGGSTRESHSPNSGDVHSHPYIRVNLTEEILLKHNAITEKDFVQQNKETKSTIQCYHSHQATTESQTLAKEFVVTSNGFDMSKYYAANAPATSAPTALNSNARKDPHGLKRCGSHSPDRNTHKFNKYSHEVSPTEKSSRVKCHLRVQKRKTKCHSSASQQTSQSGNDSLVPNQQPTCLSNNMTHSTTERLHKSMDEFEETDADLQDDLTGSSLNSFLKSEDYSDDSMKMDSRTCFPTEKAIENPNWNASSYTMVTRELQDVLKSDLKLLSKMNQPSQVNDQLSQLYAELGEQKQQGQPSNNKLSAGIEYQDLVGDDIVSKFFDKMDYEDDQLYLLDDFPY